MRGFCIAIIIFCCLSSQAQITYQYGNYTGSGSATTISGLTFSPDAVIIKSEAATEAYFATRDMVSKAKALGTGSVLLESGIVTGWTDDGFTLGTDAQVNDSGVEFHFIAFDDAGDCYVGTYTGTASLSETIASESFAADLILNCGDEAATSGDATIFFESLGVGSSEGFYPRSGGTTATDNHLATITATGFTTGTGANSPQNDGIDYYYLGLNASGSVFSNKTFTADNGSDDRSHAIQEESTTNTFQPDFIIVHRNALAPVFRVETLTGDKTLSFSATAVESNLIQQFEAGGIQAGNDTRVNQAWQVHHFAAFSGGSELLPVEMVSFDLEDRNDHIALKWTTASEINNDHFIIERSSDGQSFQAIGSILGYGNTSELKDYVYYDQNPVKGVSYYRLKQVDYDGKFEYSDVETISFNSDIEENFWMPTNLIDEGADIFINYHSSDPTNIAIEFYNFSGEKIYDVPSEYIDQKGLITIESADLSKGNYILVIRNEGEVLYTKRMVIVSLKN